MSSFPALYTYFFVLTTNYLALTDRLVFFFSNLESAINLTLRHNPLATHVAVQDVDREVRLRKIFPRVRRQVGFVGRHPRAGQGLQDGEISL